MSPLITLSDPYWRDRATCRDAEPDLFFPGPDFGSAYEAQVQQAKAVCTACPVRAECLSFNADLTHLRRRRRAEPGREVAARRGEPAHVGAPHARHAAGLDAGGDLDHRPGAAGRGPLAGVRRTRVRGQRPHRAAVGRTGERSGGVTAFDEGREYWPTATSFASDGASAWRKAVHAQLAAPPAHGDFYALAADVVDTLRAFDGLLGVLARQVAGYADGRELYDDSGADPSDRLRTAGQHLATVRRHLTEAERAANEFWSAIGHIGERS
jgi:hypothetical protein